MITALSITLLAVVNVALIFEILGLKRRLKTTNTLLGLADSRISYLECRLSLLDDQQRRMASEFMSMRSRGAA